MSATDVLVKAVEVPVRRTNRRPRLHETTKKGWPRRVDTTRGISDCELLCAPVVVSGGTAWRRHDPNLEIVGNAVLLDGARRLLAAVMPNMSTAPCVVVFGLTASEELQWHLHLNESRVSTNDRSQQQAA